MNPQKSKALLQNQTRPNLHCFRVTNNQTKVSRCPRDCAGNCLTGVLDQHQQNRAAVTAVLLFICRIAGESFNFSDSQFLYTVIKFSFYFARNFPPQRYIKI